MNATVGSAHVEIGAQRRNNATTAALLATIAASTTDALCQCDHVTGDAPLIVMTMLLEDLPQRH